MFFKNRRKELREATGGKLSDGALEKISAGIADATLGEAKRVLQRNGGDSQEERMQRFMTIRGWISSNPDVRPHLVLEELATAIGMSNGIRDGGALSRHVLQGALASSQAGQLGAMLKMAGAPPEVTGPAYEAAARNHVNAILGMARSEEPIALTLMFEEKAREMNMAVVAKTTRTFATALSPEDLASATSLPVDQVRAITGNLGELAESAITKLDLVSRYRSMQNGAASWALALIETADDLADVEAPGKPSNGMEALAVLTAHLVLSRVAEAGGQARNDTEFTPEQARKALDKFRQVVRFAEAHITGFMTEGEEGAPAAEPKKAVH